MERGLRKELTLLDVFCVATGAIDLALKMFGQEKSYQSLQRLLSDNDVADRADERVGLHGKSQSPQL